MTVDWSTRGQDQAATLTLRPGSAPDRGGERRWLFATQDKMSGTPVCLRLRVSPSNPLVVVSQSILFGIVSVW